MQTRPNFRLVLAVFIPWRVGAEDLGAAARDADEGTVGRRLPAAGLDLLDFRYEEFIPNSVLSVPPRAAIYARAREGRESRTIQFRKALNSSG
jgi:hypothetical protein